MKNFADTIRETIEKENIKPIPKWVFWGKNISFFCIFIFSVLLGALALSIVFYYIFEGGFESLHPRFINIVSSIPLFWVLSFIGFGIFSFFGMKHIPKGYKVSFLSFIGINIFLTIVFGSIFYILNIPESIEKYSSHIPFHRQLDERIDGFWMNPREGRIAGEIVMKKENIVYIQTRLNEEWKIIIPKQSHFFKRMNEKKNIRIKIEGEVISLDKKIFKAHKILPWRHHRFQIEK